MQGAESVGRLTNLTGLNVDTSWYNRYRSPGNPDFGDDFPQLVKIEHRSTIPTDDRQSSATIQGIAHCAAFHFAAIEQGGGSLYLSLMPKVSSLVVLDILGRIGPVEIYHFSAFHKSLEHIFGYNAGGGLIFPTYARSPPWRRRSFPSPANSSVEICRSAPSSVRGTPIKPVPSPRRPGLSNRACSPASRPPSSTPSSPSPKARTPPPGPLAKNKLPSFPQEPAPQGPALSL